ncbi:MAG: glycosyltransferase family 2 protein [Burkholderiales bacterium]
MTALQPLPSARARSPAVELAIVAPTFNEKDNVAELTTRLEQTLHGIPWEIVFVDDDSPDGTAEVVVELAQLRPNVRCLRRIGRRGLSRAVVEGILATTAPYIAVMDADLQHDETLLPKMLARLRQGDLDVVVGSRYATGGSIGAWKSSRAAMSRWATAISRLVVTADLSDPMSGFFMIRRDAFLRAVRNLSGEGYKILLDIFASSPTPLRFAEISYTFRSRRAGQSKLDSAVMWEYLMLIADKRFGHILPARFIMFSVVGLSGVAVHMASLGLFYEIVRTSFAIAQTIATLVAMTSNYWLNNLLTYHDRRRRGLRFVTGLLSFYAICSVGVVANVGVASFVFHENVKWWLAGVAGAVVGTVWNYGASAIFTWKSR